MVTVGFILVVLVQRITNRFCCLLATRFVRLAQKIVCILSYITEPVGDGTQVCMGLLKEAEAEGYRTGRRLRIVSTLVLQGSYE